MKYPQEVVVRVPNISRDIGYDIYRKPLFWMVGSGSSNLPDVSDGDGDVLRSSPKTPPGRTKGRAGGGDVEDLWLGGLEHQFLFSIYG